MLDRVENRQAKRDRDKFDRLGGVIRRIQSNGHVLANVRFRFVLGTAPSHVSIMAGKCIRENTALRTKFRGGVRVQACHAAVSLEFAFGRLGVMRGRALIGQRTWWLMT